MGDEEPELPTLPPSSPPLPPYASLRKSSGRGYASSNSSDVPFFSSDDLAEASIDNYISPRKKRQHKRAWYEAEDPGSEHPHIRRRRSKHAGACANDSGVFMASDSSSADDGFSTNPISVDNLKRNNNKIYRSFHQQNKQLGGEALAHKIIHECLEAGTEVVDLSSCNLTCLSDNTLQPLRQLIRQPKSEQLPHIEAAFHAFTPSLKLFLASNRLTHVPSSIWMLENLTVLSLRNNDIAQLPHAIGRLVNLVELNVASNRLEWLPWELLGLVERKLINLNAMPNPMISFEGQELHQESGVDSVSYPRPKRIASSPVTYCDMDGTPCLPQLGNSLTAVPSLLELSLQAISDTIPMSEMHNYLPDNRTPVIDQVLDMARINKNEGKRHCTTAGCGRRFIIPRAQWFEFWYANVPRSVDAMPLPFLRQACSWKCAASNFGG